MIGRLFFALWTWVISVKLLVSSMTASAKQRNPSPETNGRKWPGEHFLQLTYERRVLLLFCFKVMSWYADCSYLYTLLLLLMIGAQNTRRRIKTTRSHARPENLRWMSILLSFERILVAVLCCIDDYDTAASSCCSLLFGNQLRNVKTKWPPMTFAHVHTHAGGSFSAMMMTHSSSRCCHRYFSCCFEALLFSKATTWYFLFIIRRRSLNLASFIESSEERKWHLLQLQVAFRFCTCIADC